MTILIILAVFICAFIFDYKKVIKEGNKKDYIIYGSFLFISFAVLMISGFGVKLPSPINYLDNIIKDIIKQ